MQINNINSLNLENNKYRLKDDVENTENKPVETTEVSKGSEPNFRGIGIGMDTFLRFLDTNKAFGATAVDLGCMVIPRTASDFSRGKDAGVETMRREGSSSANHALVGVYGVTAGALMAGVFNKKFGLKFNKIFASDKLVEYVGQSWHDEIHRGNKSPLRKHLEKMIASLEGFNTNVSAQDGYVKIPEETQKLVVDRLEKEIQNSNNAKLNKDAERYMHNLITAATGAETQVRLKNAKGAVDGLELKNALENIYSLTKAMNSEKLIDTFKRSSEFSANEFIKSMKKFNKMRSLGGIAIASAIGMSIQPINMYLTKKKTGKTEFVGGGKKDDSFGFKVKKTIAAIAFALGSFACISRKPSEIIPKLGFKGSIPSLDQYKAVYGLTIMSRFMAARNGNELIESAVKDTIGFLSWLILGNVVAKATAYGLDKSLVNIKSGEKGKWLLKGNVKSRDEVLLSALKNHGIDTVQDGKALKFRELMKKLPASDKITKVKLRKLTVAQWAGYLYSALVLGVGIPKLNAYMTNRREAKKALAETPLSDVKQVENANSSEQNEYFKNDIKMENFQAA